MVQVTFLKASPLTSARLAGGRQTLFKRVFSFGGSDQKKGRDSNLQPLKPLGENQVMPPEFTGAVPKLKEVKCDHDEMGPRSRATSEALRLIHQRNSIASVRVCQSLPESGEDGDCG
jgi:hypothetical protein